MRTNYRSALIANLLTIIVLFVILSLFDHSGNNQRNTLLVILWFVIMMLYDWTRIWLKNRQPKK